MNRVLFSIPWAFLALSAEALSGPLPDVVGETLEDATEAIERNYIRYGPFVVDDIIYEASLTVPEGVVLRTDPVGGTSLPPYSPVDVYVSSGLPPADTELPDVVGFTETAAWLAIEGAGFVMGDVTRVISDTVPEDTVINQNPAGNSLAPAGLAIDLTISLGPSQPDQAVPDVTLLHLPTATDMLQNAGLIPNVTGETFSDQLPDDSVLSQHPPAGTLVFTGTSVDLVISRFGVALENYVGADYRQALELLLIEGFLVDVVGDRDSAAPYGEVLAQHPLGPLADPGATIRLTVSGDERFLRPPPVFDSSELQWVRGFRGDFDVISHAVCVDTMGNVLTTGIFRGEVDFDPSFETFSLTPRDRNDMFVVKLDANGLFKWAGSLGSVDAATGYAIDTDDAGNVYVTGRYSDFVDPSDVLGAEVDGFVLKLDPEGDLLWDRRFDGIGQGIAVSGDGSVHVTGIINDPFSMFDIGDGDIRAVLRVPGDELCFAWKMDGDGKLLWVEAFGSDDSEDSSEDVVVDALGNVYMTGYFEGAANFDPGNGEFNAVAADNVSIFISKLNSGGKFQWARIMDGPNGGGNGLDLVLDASGNVYGTGSFYGTTAFDNAAPTPIQLTSSAFRDVYVTKLTPDGDVLWAKRNGGLSSDEGTGIAVDGRGFVVTTGYFRIAFDWDPGPGSTVVPYGGFEDIFIWGLDSDGDFAFATGMGAGEVERPHGLALDAHDNMYIAGQYGAPTDLAPGDVTFALPGRTNGFSAFTGKYARVRPVGDIDGDGIANAVDIQYVINAALGLEIPSTFDADVNSDDAVDATDIQTVINNVLGL